MNSVKGSFIEVASEDNLLMIFDELFFVNSVVSVVWLVVAWVVWGIFFCPQGLLTSTLHLLKFAHLISQNELINVIKNFGLHFVDWMMNLNRPIVHDVKVRWVCLIICLYVTTCVNLLVSFNFMFDDVLF